MKAILLATGEKAKLMPLTAAIPSPLLPVANRPVIVHGIEPLVQSGIKDILICLQHRAAAIKTTLGSGERSGHPLSVPATTQRLGISRCAEACRAYVF